MFDTGLDDGVWAVAFQLGGLHVLNGSEGWIRRWRLVDSRGVEGRDTVFAVDVSPDSTRFATGTGMGDNNANIWNIRNGERQVGPLKHDEPVAGIRFSPDGDHVATSSHGSSVRIFDSHNSDPPHRDQHRRTECILANHPACVVQRRSTNFDCIGRQQGQVFRRVHGIPAR